MSVEQDQYRFKSTQALAWTGKCDMAGVSFLFLKRKKY